MNLVFSHMLFTHIEGPKASIVAFFATKREHKNPPEGQGGAIMNLCTRLKGKILEEAMPWHHRYIGNPLITGLSNNSNILNIVHTDWLYERGN